MACRHLVGATGSRRDFATETRRGAQEIGTDGASSRRPGVRDQRIAAKAAWNIARYFFGVPQVGMDFPM